MCRHRPYFQVRPTLVALHVTPAGESVCGSVGRLVGWFQTSAALRLASLLIFTQPNSTQTVATQGNSRGKQTKITDESSEKKCLWEDTKALTPFDNE